MKKLLFILSSLVLFFGCEKDYTDVIQPGFTNYQVTSITAIETFTFTRLDSVKTINIIFDKTTDIQSVTYSLLSPSGEEITKATANKITGTLYSFPLTMSINFAPGKYFIKYFVTDIAGKTSEIAVHYFNFENIYYTNYTPVISNVLINPDTLIVNDTTLITITAAVSDENSSQDIESVYFIVYRPDGTTNGIQTPLFDDGVKTGGKWDEIPDDGVYSLVIRVDQTNQKGTYRFDFRARDRGKALSEIVSYNVLIQ